MTRLESVLVFELVKLLDATDTAADETDDDDGEGDVLIVGNDRDLNEPPNVGTAGIFSLGKLLSTWNSVTFPRKVEGAEIVDKCDPEDGKSFPQDSGVNELESLSPVVELEAIVILLFGKGISLDLIFIEGVSVVE